MASGTTLEYCDRTDVGRRRSSNQDARAVLEPWDRELYRRRGWLFVVADGMGAHAAGELASAIAAEQVPLVYEKLAPRSPPLALQQAIRQANEEIHAKGESSLDLKGMGTTCTALAIVPRGALVGHVGDSRAYRVRRGRIEQLSQDHSLVWEMQAQQSPGVELALPKNIITRSLGPHPAVKIDIEGPYPVEADDIFVLCSDGLSGQVEDGEIGLLAGMLRPREAAAALVGLALVRGGPDNITVIVARAGPKEASKAAPADPPWPLTEQPPTAAPLPWRRLATAAVSLFVALVSFGVAKPLLTGWPDGAAPTAAGGPWGAGGMVAMLILALLAGLTFLAALLFAVLGFLGSGGQDGAALPVGKKLGSGPYRNHDCAPGADLVNGMVASVEAALEGLAGPTRARAEDSLRRARGRLAAGDHEAAVEAVAAAVATYAGAVEAARSAAGRDGTAAADAG